MFITSYISVDFKEVNLLKEISILVCLIRRLLDERGYAVQGDYSKRTLPYCMDKNNKIDVLLKLVPEFFGEMFPSYMSEILM